MLFESTPGGVLRLRVHQALPDLLEFSAWFVRKMFWLASATIPIAAIAGLTLDFVEDRMNPRGAIVVRILLHDAVGCLPFVSQRQLNSLEKFFVHTTPFNSKILKERTSMTFDPEVPVQKSRLHRQALALADS